MIICFSQTNAKNHRPKNTQLKVYQDRGMVIVVINHDDLQQVAKGVSFIPQKLKSLREHALSGE
jgi:hypothetical protein